MTRPPGQTPSIPYDPDASGAPVTEPYQPPGVSGARITGAVLLTIVYFILIGYVPYYIEEYAVKYGLSAPISPTFLLFAGAIVAIVAGLSIATKPTRAWGPVRVLSAGVDIVYIFYLLQNPIYTTTIHGFSITLAYARILELLLIPPVIALIAGVVTTIGDIRHPWERVRLQFPQPTSWQRRSADGQAI
ncbi:MAG: hypothetical protein L3J97_05160 [Thermoplasmata archaeon]|nr:hypothetical protein [Thermoplasmata archaeon]